MRGFRKEIKNSLKSLNYKLNYFSGNYRRRIWLIGDGRSGTTWAAGLINWKKNLREMFEPFHPFFVEEAKNISRHLYVRADDKKNDLNRVAPLVFSGKLVNRRVDADNSFRRKYDGLLIKDIFANLFAFWAARRFPDLKIILLIRNPFAVALSKRRTNSTLWMTEPKDFLQQSELFEDHLNPFKDLFLQTGDDYFEKQILIWSVIHYVPLRQFERERILPVFYEDLYTNPEREMKKICEFTDAENENGWTKIFDKPSRVAWEKSNVVSGKSPVTAWQSEVSKTQIKNSEKILERFGFARLYDDRGMPQKSVLDNFFHQPDIKTARAGR